MSAIISVIKVALFCFNIFECKTSQSSWLSTEPNWKKKNVKYINAQIGSWGLRHPLTSFVPFLFPNISEGHNFLSTYVEVTCNEIQRK